MRTYKVTGNSMNNLCICNNLLHLLYIISLFIQRCSRRCQAPEHVAWWYATWNHGPHTEPLRWPSPLGWCPIPAHIYTTRLPLCIPILTLLFPIMKISILLKVRKVIRDIPTLDVLLVRDTFAKSILIL